MDENGLVRSAQAHKRNAHDDGSVTCDIVVVVGFSSLVPLLKWACAHQAGSRFQNKVTAKSLKNGNDLAVWDKKSIFASTKELFEAMR